MSAPKHGSSWLIHKKFKLFIFDFTEIGKISITNKKTSDGTPPTTSSTAESPVLKLKESVIDEITFDNKHETLFVCEEKQVVTQYKEKVEEKPQNSIDSENRDESNEPSDSEDRNAIENGNIFIEPKISCNKVVPQIYGN